MKRILAVLLLAVMVFSLAACSGKNDVIPEQSADTNRPVSESAKTLVVYFSMPDDVDDSTVTINGEILGNTQYMAYVIQDNTNANIFRIIPKTAYPTNHDELIDYAKEEQNNNARPEIEGTIDDFDSYDTIFIGYPNWWGDMPMILYTFFDTYDFSGKTIIPFNTHGGSGFSSTIQTIKGLEPNADVDEGLSISRNDIEDAEQEIIDWVKSLGFEKTETEGIQNSEISSDENTETVIRLTSGDVVITATLDNSETTKAFIDMLPMTLNMSNYNDREYYGHIDTLPENGETIEDYTNGDITYYPQGPSLAIFYAKDDTENLGGLIRMGRITSDYSTMQTLGNSAEFLIEIVG